jgi:pimeloyl-ACP methyl ester carboxylesterase
VNRLVQARARLDAIRAEERSDIHIDPANATDWRLGDEVAPTAVVLLHGLSNGPLQYERLAPQLAERGHAVIVPRMPYHGYRDRMTNALAALRASDLEAAALRAVSIAALCGERVVVAGISVGATLAGWLAARTAIDTAIAIAPFCGVRGLYGGLNDLLGATLRAAPNRFAWWDPRRKEAQPPLHGYPRYSTRAVGESLLLSTALDGVAGPHAHARRVDLVQNAHEPVVNDAFARSRFASLERMGITLNHVVWGGLPPIHDVIEPQIPQARIDLVYPRLIALIESPSP